MSLKEILYQRCLEIVDSKVSLAEKAMKAAQESANAEGKSTAGDKYDTARAMSHIERDMFAKQFVEAISLKKGLNALNINSRVNQIELGALVMTDFLSYFIAVGLGQISIDNKDYFVISPMSPIGQQLIGKKKDDEFLFQGKTVTILNVL